MATTIDSNVLQTLGLQEITHPLNDTLVLVTADGKALNSQNADDYFENLTQRVVMQELFDSFVVPKQFQGFIREEIWINGIKEFLLDGLGTFTKFDKKITIDDFNADNLHHMSYLWGADQKDYVKIIKPSVDKIMSAFTSTATLTEFVNSLVEKLSKTWEDRFFIEKACFMFGVPHTPGTGVALPPASHDKIINWGALNTEEKAKFLKQFITALQTPSSDHIAYSNDTVKYTGNDAITGIIYNNAFKQELALDVNAKLFNAKAIMPNIKESTIDLTALKEVPVQLAAAIDCVVTDLNKYGRGHQLKDELNVIQTPKMQQLMEKHNWYGYNVIFNKQSAIFLDTSNLTPDQILFLQTATIFNDASGNLLATHTPVTVDVTVTNGGN